ncbi:hypothetical protein BDV96DRAFT_77655 [Lophiotrema nucula]|uniref:Uncharacterized protein n=1 Tax=Lophiotrema nucula TaxID=690887 RepID=A0A6A5Z7M4_9PLEO|nr:hypothetical protein BDV96DRAFT_77655 [Lophiotrema nucula]
MVCSFFAVGGAIGVLSSSATEALLSPISTARPCAVGISCAFDSVYSSLTGLSFALISTSLPTNSLLLFSPSPNLDGIACSHFFRQRAAASLSVTVVGFLACRKLLRFRRFEFLFDLVVRCVALHIFITFSFPLHAVCSSSSPYYDPSCRCPENDDERDAYRDTDCRAERKAATFGL